MFRAVCSKFFRFSAWSSMHESSTPTGAAKLSLQSLRSVESFSNRKSVPSLPGKSSTSERVCRHRMSSPMRISSGYSPMSFSEVVSVWESEKYFSMMPARPSSPVISGAVSRASVMKPLSFMIRSNCPTASTNFVTVSLSVISCGTILPLQSVEKSLCRRLRSLVVFVRNR